MAGVGKRLERKGLSRTCELGTRVDRGGVGKREEQARMLRVHHTET